jgi:hypothetical protein
MEIKGIQYSVSEDGGGWRWIVHLKDGLKTGFAGNRTLAILAAIKAIKGAATREKRAKQSTSAPKLANIGW